MLALADADPDFMHCRFEEIKNGIMKLAAKQQFKAFRRVIAIAARPEASSNRVVG